MHYLICHDATHVALEHLPDPNFHLHIVKARTFSCFKISQASDLTTNKILSAQSHHEPICSLHTSHSCQMNLFSGKCYAHGQLMMSAQSKLECAAADHHAAVQWAIPKEGVVHRGRWGRRLCHPVCSLGCRHIPIGTSQAHHLWSSCSEYTFTPSLRHCHLPLYALNNA